MDFLEALKFTVSVIRSIAVQLRDNISDNWSSIELFRREIVINFTCWQNFHDISPLQKTVNSYFLFRIQYNCPVFPSNIQDWRRSGQRFFDILILFCGDDLFSPSKLSHGRLPKYLIDGRTFWTNRNDPYAGVRTDSKKPPVRRFFKLFPPQSPRGFCALARLYYLARPTKTAMLCRLHYPLLALLAV